MPTGFGESGSAGTWASEPVPMQPNKEADPATSGPEKAPAHWSKRTDGSEPSTPAAEAEAPATPSKDGVKPTGFGKSGDASGAEWEPKELSNGVDPAASAPEKATAAKPEDAPTKQNTLNVAENGVTTSINTDGANAQNTGAGEDIVAVNGNGVNNVNTGAGEDQLFLSEGAQGSYDLGEGNDVAIVQGREADYIRFAGDDGAQVFTHKENDNSFTLSNAENVRYSDDLPNREIEALKNQLNEAGIQSDMIKGQEAAQGTEANSKDLGGAIDAPEPTGRAH